MSNPEYVKALDAARAETQSECPHNEFLKYGGPDRAVSCGKCGQRFVPSDVLEEAQDALESVEWVWCEPIGDKVCSYCGARAFHTGDGPHRKHEPNCKLAAALARIDGVLGANKQESATRDHTKT